MLLFIASEVMLFGSFFTAYFFIRVVNSYPWPPEGFELPRYVAGVNTAILVTSSFTVHWALQSIRRGNRAGMQAGLVLTFLDGPDVPADADRRVRARRLRAAATTRSRRSSSASPACTAPTSSSA